MIKPINPEQARKCLMLASSCFAAKAFLDGYEGVDHSLSCKTDSERSFYKTYWLKGNLYREERIEEELSKGKQL